MNDCKSLVFLDFRNDWMNRIAGLYYREHPDGYDQCVGVLWWALLVGTVLKFALTGEVA